MRKRVTKAVLPPEARGEALIWDASEWKPFLDSLSHLVRLFVNELRLISEFDLQRLAIKLDCHIAKISDERPMS